VVSFGDSAIIGAAQQELLKGLRGMLGRIPRVERSLPSEDAIVLGTLEAIRQAAPALALTADLKEDSFWLKTVSVNGVRCLVITGPNERGVLYGYGRLQLRTLQPRHQ
jgi:alpha-glucuronidase